jgi:hypothetical protein
MSGSSDYRVNACKSLAATIVGATLFWSAAAPISHAKQQHFSTREGRTIRMQPFGSSFQIPPDWTLDDDGVVLTRTELKKVKKGREEWFTEYAKIANAALPFVDCSVQAGSQRWDSAGIDGLQMRGYVVDSIGADVQKEISTKGFAASKKLPSKVARGAAIKKDDFGQWRRILITSDLWYRDYGGKGNVVFYLNTHDGKTVVLVFMYAIEGKYVPTIQQILQSFSW